MDEETEELIEKLRVASSVEKTIEVIRDALGVYDFIHEKVNEGYSVGFFKENEKVIEINVFNSYERSLNYREPLKLKSWWSRLFW